MLGRRKKTENEVQAEQVAHPHREGAKNRPTPKRRDQEAARKRPLVATNDRKSARQADRAARREAYAKSREAMLTGDDRHLPARDKGPVRRYVRDLVDARFNLGEILLPLMLVMLVLTLFANTWATIVFLGVYVVVFLAVIDAALLWRRIKRRILAKFGEDTPLRGLAMYTVMRSFQMRRTRMPRPQVERGAKVS